MTTTRRRRSARSRSLCSSARGSGRRQLGDLRASLLAELLEAQRVDAVRLLAQDAGAAVDARPLGQLELEQLVDGQRAVRVYAHAARADVHRVRLDHLAGLTRQDAREGDFGTPAAPALAPNSHSGQYVSQCSFMNPPIATRTSCRMTPLKRSSRRGRSGGCRLSARRESSPSRPTATSPPSATPRRC